MAFGVLSMPCPVVTLSSKPDRGLTTVCLPFIYLPIFDKNEKGTKDVELMVEALGVLVWMVAREACPRKKAALASRAAKLVRTPHKAEWKGDKDGLLWFNKACESSRMATTIVATTEKKGKLKEVRAKGIDPVMEKYINPAWDPEYDRVAFTGTEPSLLE